MYGHRGVALVAWSVIVLECFGLEKLEQELENKDLSWISNFERAVVHAVNEVPDIKSVDPRVLAALTPILNHPNSFGRLSEVLDENAVKTKKRVLSLLAGGRAFLEGASQSFTDMWEKGEIDLASAQKFSGSMYDNSILPAQIHCSRKPFSDLQHVVDLGGGGGAWAHQATEHHAKLNFTVFDLANVCLATKEILELKAPALSSRTDYATGSFFRDALPKSDGFLMSNILHDWPPSTCEKLLSHIRSHVAKGSKLYIHECLLDENKLGPRFTCLFNFLMLLNHASQQFTFSELKHLLEKSGFRNAKVISRAAHYSLVECIT